MLLHEYLERNAKQYPDKIALIFGKKRITYKQIDEDANRLANALIRLGLKKGDRVSIFLDNSIETVISIYGTLKAGGIFLVLSSTLKSKKIEYILNNSESSFLITQFNKYKIIESLRTKLGSLCSYIICDNNVEISNKDVLDWDNLLNTMSCSKPIIQCIDMDLAYIIYTSGSTGEPKGVMMTHHNAISAATSIITYLENTESDIILNVLPLSFDYGLYQILMTYIFGGTVVLEKFFSHPYILLNKMIKENITGFPGIPTIFAILLQLDLKKYDIKNLRYISNTGAVLPITYIKGLKEIFTNTKIFSMYGLTECKRVSYLPPEEIDHRPTSVGKAMPNVEVFIIDENGNRVGPGVIGELVIRGSNVMRGYWKSQEETDKVLKPGYYAGEKILFSGDLFKMDEEGFLYFVSRKDDIIKTRGERVSPKEIENIIYEIKGVAEVAVIGVPDEILGNAIKAFIVKKKDFNICKEDIIRNCANNLESFMVPKHVEFLESFPKTNTGKIDKKILK